jgi:hypothetical protein
MAYDGGDFGGENLGDMGDSIDMSSGDSTLDMEADIEQDISNSSDMGEAESVEDIDNFYDAENSDDFADSSVENLNPPTFEDPDNVEEKSIDLSGDDDLEKPDHFEFDSGEEPVDMGIDGAFEDTKEVKALTDIANEDSIDMRDYEVLENSDNTENATGIDGDEKPDAPDHPNFDNDEESTDMGGGEAIKDMGVPGSDTDDDLGEGLSDDSLPRMEPIGPDDREASRWNAEADAIEAWAAEVDDPEAYSQDVQSRICAPSDSEFDEADIPGPYDGKEQIDVGDTIEPETVEYPGPDNGEEININDSEEPVDIVGGKEADELRDPKLDDIKEPVDIENGEAAPASNNINYDTLDNNTFAQYNAENNEILVNEDLKVTDEALLSTLLSHEAIHADYHSEDPADEASLQTYVDEEVEAYRAQLERWQQVKNAFDQRYPDPASREVLGEAGQELLAQNRQLELQIEEEGWDGFRACLENKYRDRMRQAQEHTVLNNTSSDQPTDFELSTDTDMGGEQVSSFDDANLSHNHESSPPSDKDTEPTTDDDSIQNGKKPDEQTDNQGIGQGEQLGGGEESNNFETDEYLEAHHGFAALYHTLQQEGVEPDLESGAIHPPNYPNVGIMPNGEVYGSYKELRGYLRSEELTSCRGSEILGFEAHHLLENRLMEPFGFSEGEGMCVAAYSDEHMNLVHGENGVDFQLPRGYRYNIQDVVEGHIQAYNDIGHPEWAEAVRDYARVNQDRIIEAYENGTVPWATEEDTKRAREYLRSL